MDVPIHRRDTVHGRCRSMETESTILGLISKEGPNFFFFFQSIVPINRCVSCLGREIKLRYDCLKNIHIFIIFNFFLSSLHRRTWLKYVFTVFFLLIYSSLHRFDG